MLMAKAIHHFKIHSLIEHLKNPLDCLTCLVKSSSVARPCSLWARGGEIFYRGGRFPLACLPSSYATGKIKVKAKFLIQRLKFVNAYCDTTMTPSLAKETLN